ncbi:hypothetical protein [Pseudonocardia xishanensis]|uniref:Uncharacterized protein n=1 Tax=Pseudonocardia xishanensis TaxID=630995 RepID=A0ABP8RYU4_9PSEU
MSVGRSQEQAVMATARLIGPQSTEVQIIHPGTDDAAVSVRIGKVLIYIHEEKTAEHFHKVWEQAQDAADMLPASGDVRLVRALRGMPEPAIAANAIGLPASAVTAGKTKGDPPRPFLRVQLGRVVFEVRDQFAFNTCAHTFAYARKQAAKAFVEPGRQLIVHGAFEVAGDAFFPDSEAEQFRRPGGSQVPPPTHRIETNGATHGPGAPRVDCRAWWRSSRFGIGVGSSDERRRFREPGACGRVEGGAAGASRRTAPRNCHIVLLRSGSL